MSMKGETIEYINMEGDVIYGLVCEGVHKHAFDTSKNMIRDAIKVVWMDDGSITTEILEDVLDPETSLTLL